MSGLAARFHRDGHPVDPASVSAMLDAIPYRGIDGCWVREWGNIALGFAKTTITPEEIDEQQPTVSPRTGCALIADVRLDNRDELRSRLGNRLPVTISDAELILHAYEAWGEEMVSRLLGDFAIALWDPRNRQILCARDTSGQRTLYYQLSGSTFAVASEIHQLFQDPATAIEPNDERILSFLTPQNMFRNEAQQAETFFKGVFALPPAHAITVGEEAHRLWKYWDLDPRSNIRYRNDDEYVEHFRELFFTTVGDRLRSTQPVGALLSGGLDSASIACVAQEIYRSAGAGNGGFTSFSYVFDDLNCDESAYLDAIRAKYGFEMRSIVPSTYSGRLQPEPKGFLESPNMGIGDELDAMFRTIQSSGIRMVLSGDVADGCVAGSWIVFDSLLRQGRFRRLYEHIQAYRESIDPSWNRVALYSLAPLLPLRIQRQVMVMRKRRQLRHIQHLLLPGWMPESLRTDLAERAGVLALERERERLFSNETREFEYRVLYPPAIARDPAPWSVTISRPFADRRIHEFLLAIPPEQKFNTSPDAGSSYARSKWILRRAMNGILPEEIRTRSQKTVFSQVLENEIQQQWPIYRATFEPPAVPELVRRGYVDHGRFWERVQEAHVGAKGADMVYLMQMIGLETWLRTFQLPRHHLTTIPLPRFTPATPTIEKIESKDIAMVP